MSLSGCIQPLLSTPLGIWNMCSSLVRSKIKLSCSIRFSVWSQSCLTALNFVSHPELAFKDVPTLFPLGLLLCVIDWSVLPYNFSITYWLLVVKIAPEIAVPIVRMIHKWRVLSNSSHLNLLIMLLFPVEFPTHILSVNPHSE